MKDITSLLHRIGWDALNEHQRERIADALQTVLADDLRDDGGPAFPVESHADLIGILKPGKEGMTMRQFYAAHAPDVPEWFRLAPLFHAVTTPEEAGTAARLQAKVDADLANEAMRFFEWRHFYADGMLNGFVHAAQKLWSLRRAESPSRTA